MNQWVTDHQAEMINQTQKSNSDFIAQGKLPKE